MKKIMWGLIILVVVALGPLDLKSGLPKVVEAPAKVTTTEATNSEGNLKLMGTSRKSMEGGTAYEFKIMDSQKKTELSLYQTIADKGSEMEVPFNSWSPDYKQVFVKTKSPGGENYYLFRADGEVYADGSKYIPIGDYWKEAEMKTEIKTINGWAGDDLLMVYTENDDGSGGPAYWFVTSTRKFTQVREF